MKAELFLQKIRNEFPEVKWKHHRFLTHGWDHIVIVLDDKMIFRAPKDVPKDLQSELYDELKSALGYKFERVLLHNDLTWEHILWDKKKQKVNIIDFSDRSYGDPASDFAGLWEFGSKLTKRVYELYRGKKDDTLLYRSRLYFKRIPLFVMKDALDGYPCTFKEGYEMFKERYYNQQSLSCNHGR